MDCFVICGWLLHFLLSKLHICKIQMNKYPIKTLCVQGENERTSNEVKKVWERTVKVSQKSWQGAAHSGVVERPCMGMDGCNSLQTVIAKFSGQLGWAVECTQHGGHWNVSMCVCDNNGVCLCVRSLCLCVCLCLCVSVLACVCMCVYIFMYVCIWINIYMYMYVYIYIYIYIYIYVYVYIYINIYLYISMSRSLSIYISIYISTYIYLSIYLSIYISTSTYWSRTRRRTGGTFHQWRCSSGWVLWDSLCM